MITLRQSREAIRELLLSERTYRYCTPLQTLLCGWRTGKTSEALTDLQPVLPRLTKNRGNIQTSLSLHIIKLKLKNQHDLIHTKEKCDLIKISVIILRDQFYTKQSSKTKKHGAREMVQGHSSWGPELCSQTLHRVAHDHRLSSRGFNAPLWLPQLSTHGIQSQTPTRHINKENNQCIQLFHKSLFSYCALSGEKLPPGCFKSLGIWLKVVHTT